MPSESPGPFAAEFAQARDQATTDFERDVLEDDEIAVAELDEARQRFARCVEDLGYTVSFGELGMRIEYPGVDASNATETEAASQKAIECEVGSMTRRRIPKSFRQAARRLLRDRRCRRGVRGVGCRLRRGHRRDQAA
ncbi:hypothetical protein EQW78_11935 [Oerskovia turbata]|uniref:Uncharacterized protein n=1 Tax=Oerskovia turbata TaxID=1713 RepID=A0A4Q1KU48_9CELL|nr:hypothetical protein [Oerskovia turbata]RXR25722.1 hypothetical protein EQW73_09410 [Oerskovia turbata]RXR33190.1 hypothetical protein EQW78_11935 [Oerskovia turbata]